MQRKQKNFHSIKFNDSYFTLTPLLYMHALAVKLNVMFFFETLNTKRAIK